MKGEIILQGPLIEKREKEIKHNCHPEVCKQRILFTSRGLPLDAVLPINPLTTK
jgi:hypothetical protein